MDRSVVCLENARNMRRRHACNRCSNLDLSSLKLDATCELQGRVPCASKCCRAYLDGAGHVDTSRHVETICGIRSREPAVCKRKWYRDTMRSLTYNPCDFTHVTCNDVSYLDGILQELQGMLETQQVALPGLEKANSTCSKQG